MRLPSINFIICLGDDTLGAAAAAAAAGECDVERDEDREADEADEDREADEADEDREADDKDALDERVGEPSRDDELDLCEEGEADKDEVDFLGLGGIKGVCGVNTGEPCEE